MSTEGLGTTGQPRIPAVTSGVLLSGLASHSEPKFDPILPQSSSKELQPPARLELPLNHREILQALVHPPGAALTQRQHDSPVYGQTRSLGELNVELRYGTFKVYAFETAATGRHVIALTKGDISSEEPLLVRFHSECITSEGLGGCDCDCVEQLNAALEKIEKEGRGIVFYLRQEGRGAGYHQKARDRMGVAASDNQLDTFQLYEALGLPHDPRGYGMLGECAYLMGIKAPINLMTNNPAKLQAVEGLGLQFAGRVPLEVPPNPFNAAYLTAKSSTGGHLLAQGNVESSLYPWKVQPFRPGLVPEAMRFSHDASYPLPVRAFNGTYVLGLSAADELRTLLARAQRQDILESQVELSTGEVKVKLNHAKLEAFAKTTEGKDAATLLQRSPNWFEAHVYHDVASGLNYVALEYGRHLPEEVRNSIVPLVRVQSENIFQRFPVKDRARSYDAAINQILERGRGMVLLYPEDGRGNGFSSVFLEQQLVQRRLAANAVEAAALLGLRPETRDYLPIARLISHHYGVGPVQLLLRERHKTTPTTPTMTLLDELRASGIKLQDPKFLGK
jgi:3,4-dihydroxy 2-butanone 4-phosphate synthase/GTP cyclohydrolase II